MTRISTNNEDFTLTTKRTKNTKVNKYVRLGGDGYAND